MESKKVLRIRYGGVYLDVVVDDMDRCTVIDLYIDLLDGAKKTGMALPQYPQMGYNFDMKEWPLITDIDVLKMFDFLSSSNIIDIWIHSVDAPVEGLQLARNLIDSRTSEQVMGYSKPHPVHTQVAFAPSIHISVSERFGSHMLGKKIPATTARRKGIPIIRRSHRSQLTQNQPSFGRESGTRPRTSSSNSLPIVGNTTLSVEDGDYEPSRELKDTIEEEFMSIEDQLDSDENIDLEVVEDGYEAEQGGTQLLMKSSYVVSI